MHPFHFAVETQLSRVHTIAIISNSESPRREKSNTKERILTHYLLLSEGKLLAETFMIESGALEFSPSN